MERRKIKVVHVLTDTNVGGAGTLLYHTMSAADHDRFDYTVVLPEGSRLAARLSGLACRVVCVKGGRDRSLDVCAIPAYARLLRRERPDILHAHSALAARIAGRLARVPVCVQTRHCVFPLKAWQRSGAFRCLFRHGTHLLSDRVVAVAEAARDQLCEMGLERERIEVIVNGVQPVRQCARDEVAALRERLGLDERDFAVGMVARLEDYKGQATLLRAVSVCGARLPRLRVLLVGDGSREAEYRALADELGIADRVVFCGFAEDVAPYFAVMSVNVNASSGTETSSLSLSEGMSVGVPCVVSDFGGNPKMVVDGENGLVFETGNHAELAQALTRLYEDRALLARLSDGARRHFRERLTAEGMVRRLEDMYERLLSAHGRRGVRAAAGQTT